jgi:hypothetical protein
MRGMRVVVLLALLVLLVSGCGGDPAPQEAAVDSLQLPSSWQTAKTISTSGCLKISNPDCPSVARYFLVGGDLPDLFQEAKSAIVAEGFGGIQELFPKCDFNTDSAPCSLLGTKGELSIQVDLFRPGKDVDSLGISVADRATVRIIVR